MPSHETPSVSVSRRGHRRPGTDALSTVVWVRGEQDTASRSPLALMMNDAAALDDADVVVDLSGVTYMDTSTIGALVVAHNSLRARSRSLAVRAPSPCARRLLALCGLSRLIDDDPAEAEPTGAVALGSWVEVPTADRGVEQPPLPHEPPAPEPALAEVRRRIDPVVSLRRRAPS